MIPGTVAVGWATGGTNDSMFTRSLVNAVAWSVDKIAGHVMIIGGPRIASNRNQIVTQFLRGDAEWLLMVDSDMVFDHTFINRMVEAADVDKMPILGALCFGIKDGNRIYPTIYKLPDEATIENPMLQRPMLMHTELTGEPIEVDATGAAALIIHRRVLEVVGAKYPKPYRWFAESTLGEFECGEDITFCLRAKAAGFPIWVHTGIDVGHVKPKVIDLALYQAMDMLPADRGEVVQLPHPDWKTDPDPIDEPEADIG